jgi:hypothetical protein
MKSHNRIALFILFVSSYAVAATALWRYYKRTTVVAPYTITYPALPHEFLFGPLSLIEGNFYDGKSFIFFLVCTFIVFALVGASIATKHLSSRITAVVLVAGIWCVLGVRLGGFILG